MQLILLKIITVVVQNKLELEKFRYYSQHWVSYCPSHEFRLLTLNLLYFSTPNNSEILISYGCSSLKLSIGQICLILMLLSPVMMIV